MLIKYSLSINAQNYNIPNIDLKNWDEIKCVYKRNGLGGVIRSFSSTFEFVGRTKDIIFKEYLTKGVNAKAWLKVFSITNNWEWREEFMCELDFSTVILTNHVLKINCIDNSISAIIKANKSTVFEFTVGTDIPTQCAFDFNRLPLIESAIYEFTKDREGITRGDGSVLVRFNKSTDPWVGRIGEAELVDIGKMDCAKDQKTEIDPSHNYCIRNISNETIAVTLEYSIRVSKLRSYGGCDIVAVKRHGTNVTTIGTLVPNSAAWGIYYVGDTPWLKNVPTYNPSAANQYAIVNGYVYQSVEQKYLPNPDGTQQPSIFYWRNTNILESDDKYSTLCQGCITTELEPGAKLSIKGIIGNGVLVADRAILSGQSMKFRWQVADEPVTFRGISPIVAAKCILEKMVESDAIEVSISNYDSRIADTVLFPAEIIRAIPNAKFYTSFNTFCNWMETVFGYTYVSESSIKPPLYHDRFEYQDTLNRLMLSPDIEESTTIQYETNRDYDGIVSPDMIYFAPDANRFVCRGTDNIYYYHWAGEYNYHRRFVLSGRHLVRTDVIFHNIAKKIDVRYNTESQLFYDKFLPYEYDEKDWRDTWQHSVKFLHRDELFKNNQPHTLHDFKDVSFKVDTSYIYSSVNIGYKEKEYDSPSGRDEFNFNNSYTTGIYTSDKVLSLLSDYRADSYGIEFCVHKRGKTSTDNESDKDVFFVLCERDDEDTNLRPRTDSISGVLSDKVFNGAFNPVRCILANQRYIGMILAPHAVNLKFASGTGNTDVTIDGISLCKDISIRDAIGMAAEVEFTSAWMSENIDFNIPYCLTVNGMTYTGYLVEATLKYARPEASKFKLLVKNISK